LHRRKDKTRRKVDRAFAAEGIDGEQAVPPDNASREAVRDILNRLFGRSAEKLVKSLADSNQLTPEEAARMKEVFGKRAKRRQRKR
jgi:predicted transcriptional regulator